MLQFFLTFMLLFSANRSPLSESAGPAADPTVSITLVITNIPKVEGVMRVALFNKAEGFRDENFAVRKEPFPVKSLRESFTFKDLPPGRYAAAIYHDTNNNGKLDTNFLGIPTESYGFSNNVMGTFGPPSYQEASFEVLSGNRVVSIKLR
jgi:uncharacterized protein (DUF2141 family)